MNKKTKKVIKFTLPAVLMAVLLYFAFRSVDWKNFVNGLRSTDFTFVLLSMLCGFSAFVLRAMRWKLLMRPLDSEIGFLRTMDGVCIGNLANCAIPFAGEFARCAAVSTKKAGFDKTLGTIALERVWDLLSIIVIVILAFVLKGSVVSDFLRENILAPITSTSVRMLWIAIPLAAIMLAVIWIIFRFKDSNSLFGKIYQTLVGLGQGFLSVLRMKHKGWFIILTILIWTMYWLMCVNISTALPAAHSLTVSDTLFIMAVGNLASVIPVPGGFGAYHYIVALALSALYGLSWDNGIVFATLSHESQALVMIVSGLICYVHRSLSMRKK